MPPTRRSPAKWSMSPRPARWCRIGHCCRTPKSTRRSGRFSPIHTLCDAGLKSPERTSMPQRLALPSVMAVAMASSLGFAQSPPPNGVKTLNPPGAIKAEGTWSLGTRAGDFVFVAGMQGIDPATNTLVQDPQARIRQAFLNIRLIAQSEGASLQDCVRLTVYVSDLHRFAPMVEKAQAELWGKPPYPPRTMIEVQRLFDDDIVEVDSVFYAPVKK